MNVPAPHGKHAVCPSLSENVPGAHGRHTVPPVTLEYSPVEQGRHPRVSLALPHALPYVPSVHAWHMEPLCLSWKNPGLHSAHAESPVESA